MGILVVIALPMKSIVRTKLLQLQQPIMALDKTGTPGAAKVLPCETHPGKDCKDGTFGNAIAQMHGCCGSTLDKNN